MQVWVKVKFALEEAVIAWEEGCRIIALLFL
jgi:hypothetical protein